jgi:hypothetical protein
MTATINLTRTYEIEVDELPGDDLQEKLDSARQLALDTFAEEMLYFESNINDFVSTKIIDIS